jgi:hypothetical protein
MSDTRRNIVYSSDRDSVADGNRFDLPFPAARKALGGCNMCESARHDGGDHQATHHHAAAVPCRRRRTSAGRSADKTIASLVVGGFGRGTNTTAWPARVCVLRPCKAQPSCISIRKYQHEQASRRFHRL